MPFVSSSVFSYPPSQNSLKPNVIHYMTSVARQKHSCVDAPGFIKQKRSAMPFDKANYGPFPNSGKLITFNVRGERFTIALNHLTAHPQTFLGHLFSTGQSNKLVHSGDEYFLDRSPDAFSKIINYYNPNRRISFGVSPIRQLKYFKQNSPPSQSPPLTWHELESELLYFKIPITRQEIILNHEKDLQVEFAFAIVEAARFASRELLRSCVEVTYYKDQRHPKADKDYFGKKNLLAMYKEWSYKWLSDKVTAQHIGDLVDNFSKGLQVRAEVSNDQVTLIIDAIFDPELMNKELEHELEIARSCESKTSVGDREDIRQFLLNVWTSSTF